MEKKLNIDGLTPSQLKRLAAYADIVRGESGLLSDEEKRKKIGRVLARLRNEKGLKQSEIAKQVGLDNANVVSMIEGGTVRVPVEKASALAAAYSQDTILRQAILKYSQPKIWKLVRDILEDLPLKKSACIIDTDVDEWVEKHCK